MPKKFDIKTLGTRQVETEKFQQFKVPKEGFAEDALVVKSVKVMVDELQCDLTVKEAKALERACGEQAWSFNEGNDRWQCVATDGVSKKRRFMVTPEVYAELRPTEVVSE